MNDVYVIRHLASKMICGVVEAAEENREEEVLHLYVMRQGLTPTATKQFRIDYCPVTTWRELQSTEWQICQQCQRPIEPKK